MSVDRVMKLLAVVALCFVAFIGLCLLGFRLRGYQFRYLDCEPEVLLPVLESALDINFPSDIREIKTAKTKPSDGAILFLVKFTADSDIVGRFIKSFPEQPVEFELRPYEYKLDQRKSAGLWPPPKWFTKQIAEGKVGSYWLAGPKMEIYIDTTNETNFVVYIEGFY